MTASSFLIRTSGRSLFAANEPVESHLTSEQAIALSLSFIAQCLKSIAESMPKK
jgi:hypothetical protein